MPLWIAQLLFAQCELSLGLPAPTNMASSCSSIRHSTRSSHPPLTLAEEQADSIRSRLEQQDMAAALRSSLASSWESDEEKEEALIKPEEEEELEEQQEGKDESDVEEVNVG